MHAYMQTCFVDLLGAEATQRGLGWVSFVSVWLLHIVDPTSRHPRHRVVSVRPILSWKQGLISDGSAGYPYRRKFHLRSRLSRSILSKTWLSTGRLSCST